jgi:hypothetical protein
MGRKLSVSEALTEATETVAPPVIGFYGYHFIYVSPAQVVLENEIPPFICRTWPLLGKKKSRSKERLCDKSIY